MIVSDAQFLSHQMLGKRAIVPSIHTPNYLFTFSLCMKSTTSFPPSHQFEFGSPIPHRRRRPLPPAKMIAIPYLTTYFSYGLLFAFGQFRDFFRKIFDWCSSNNLQVLQFSDSFLVNFYRLCI